MTGRMRGSVVLVTGAGSGIGRAVALRLASEGALVAATDINAEAVSETVAELVAAGGSGSAYEHDVASRESWAKVAGAVAAKLGLIRGLVNNAGVTRDRTLVRMTDEDWDVVMAVHLKGMWMGCQTVVPQMQEAGGGSIVNLSSESRIGAFGQANYSAAKAGVVGLTRTVAVECARYKIRCNAVAPGYIRTPMTEAVPENIREGWLPGIPLKRPGEPTEVAAAISFLLSDDASYVTGQTLNVDGGSHRS